jgi:hypothetical protein
MVKKISDMIDEKGNGRRRLTESEEEMYIEQIRVFKVRGISGSVGAKGLGITEKQYRRLEAEAKKRAAENVSDPSVQDIIDRNELFKVLIDDASEQALAAKGNTRTGFLNATRALIDSHHKFQEDAGMKAMYRAELDEEHQKARREKRMTQEELKMKENRLWAELLRRSSEKELLELRGKIDAGLETKQSKPKRVK